jgi:hypothetical protein
VLLECNNDDCAALSQALLGEPLPKFGPTSVVFPSEGTTTVPITHLASLNCPSLSACVCRYVGALAAHEGLSKGDVIVELYTILRKPSLLAALDLKVTSITGQHTRERDNMAVP